MVIVFKTSPYSFFVLCMHCLFFISELFLLFEQKDKLMIAMILVYIPLYRYIAVYIILVYNSMPSMPV